MAVSQYPGTRGGDHARVRSRVVPPRPARATMAMVVLATYLVGCFRYEPAEFPVPVGTEIAVDINEHGRAELVEVIGPGTQRVYGHVLGNNETEIVLAMTASRHEGLPNPVRWSRERVTIPRDQISNIQQRELDRTRSLIAGGLVAIGAVLATLITIEGGGSEGRGPRLPPNGDDDT